jgi:rSAM/selenodomain-associated transferase 1
MDKIEKNGVLVFIKSPETGKVKSRLSTSIDKETVIKIYKLFVKDILQKLEKIPYDIIICYHPKKAIDEIKKWLGPDYLYIPQAGKNLGERLKNGFIQGFEIGFSKLIAIGSDSPDMKLDFFNDSFKKLDFYDTVIGPSKDGGYYLIGFSKKSFYPKAFNDIPWSTEFVYEKSLESLKKRNLKTYILPIWYDVDTVEDLLYLYKNNLNTEFKNSETITFLTKFFKNDSLNNLGENKFEKR